MEVKIWRRRKNYSKTKTAKNKWLTNFKGQYAAFKINVDLNEMDITF